MIIYLDTSALVKAYVEESGSTEVRSWLGDALLVGTSPISKAEMAAAMAKSVRMDILNSEQAQTVWGKFLSEWPSIYKLAVISSTVDKAANFAWEFGLRGYDAVHLATAALWGDQSGSKITLATFDRPLWQAGQLLEMQVLPKEGW